MEAETPSFFDKAKEQLKKKSTKRVIFLLVAAYFIPWVIAFFLVCGLYDVLRNKKPDSFLFYQYFMGHGTFTWFLSPLNIVLDILTLPYWNKGVYKLEDLPSEFQEEIQSLVTTINDKNLEGELEKKLTDGDREMIFFKWYGKNIETSVDFPEFHQEFNYIRTIGVSVFNHKKSTSRHFGPIRMTLRLLYNINPMQSENVYIDVGDVRHFWHDNPMFIFDDTLLHQSVNEEDRRRYCVFVDIIRPSLMPGLMRAIVAGFGRLFIKLNKIFYNRWVFIK